MARLSVNPTRMELKNLKKKLDTSRRGHKLLKDKRDELMRRFMELVGENERRRKEVEQGINEANRRFASAQAAMEKSEFETALMLPKQEVSIELSQKNIMSVNVPVFDAKFRSQNPGDVYSYGFAFTPAELDEGVKALSDIFPKMIRLAEVEKACFMLADEIESTRRRVNALEHIMIPRYEETIKYITMKLDENERSTTTRLMKVKNMMLEQAHKH